MKRQSPGLEVRILIVLSVLVTYGLLFLPLYSLIGRVVAFLAIAPITLAAFYLSLWGGITVGLLVIPLHIGLFLLVGFPDLASLAGLEFWGGHVVILTLGITVGYLTNIRMRLRIAYEQLQELDQLKDEFVSNVMHELRSPLTSIRLNLDLSDHNPRESARYKATVQRELNRLENLVEDLLQVSRFEHAQVEFNLGMININDLVRSYVNDREQVAEAQQLQLQSRLTPELPRVQADEKYIGEVISIMLTNAFSYTPAAGQVTVSTTVREQQGRQWAGIAVSDTGPGITAQDQEHLFTRFYRGQAGRDSGKSGTGLGLAIAYEIVKRHSGMIEVESAGIAGQGTTFSIWLPALEAD